MSEVKKLEVTYNDINKVAKGTTHSSVRKFLDKLEAERDNITILVNGDSTGNDAQEFVYLYAQHLANTTRYSVMYHMWNEDINEYSSGELIGESNNGFTITIFNFSVGGAKVNYILSYEKINNGLISISDTDKYSYVNGELDLVIINHSHNCFTYSKHGDSLYLFKQFIDKVLQYYPNISALQVKQSPWRDDYENEVRVKVAVDFASKYNIGLANVWDKYEALGKADYLYADSIHPSLGLGNTGTQLHLDAIIESLTLDKQKMDATSIGYDFVGTSIAKNTNLTIFTTDTIDGFELNNVSVTQDDVVYFNPNTHSSLKLSPTEDGVASYFSYTIGLPEHLRGRTFLGTINMLKSFETETIFKGRVTLFASSNTVIMTSNINTNGDWNIEGSLIKTKPTDTYIKLIVYINSDASTTVTTDSINLDSFDIKLIENA